MLEMWKTGMITAEAAGALLSVCEKAFKLVRKQLKKSTPFYAGLLLNIAHDYGNILST